MTGVIVPLGTQHPLGRITTILANTQTSIILVDEHQAGRLDGLVPHLITLGPSLLEELAPTHAQPACTTVTPKNAAVVMFTSGSTGECNPQSFLFIHLPFGTCLRTKDLNFERQPNFS